MKQSKKINHLAIVLDGNRRWAKSRGLPTLVGHKKGYENVKKVSELCVEHKIQILTVFAFSTENWNRSKREVSYLMNLLQSAFLKDVDEFHKKGMQMKVIGQRERLSQKIQGLIKNAENKTKNNKKLLLQLAISYGGRAEIVEAVQKIINKKIPTSKITEKLLSENMWTGNQTPPDLWIRTSGEHRLSGFLTWQSVYSELYFTKTPWPAFGKKEFELALEEFEKRQRRFGK